MCANTLRRSTGRPSLPIEQRRGSVLKLLSLQGSVARNHDGLPERNVFEIASRAPRQSDGRSKAIHAFSALPSGPRREPAGKSAIIRSAQQRSAARRSVVDVADAWATTRHIASTLTRSATAARERMRASTSSGSDSSVGVSSDIEVASKAVVISTAPSTIVPSNFDAGSAIIRLRTALTSGSTCEALALRGSLLYVSSLNSQFTTSSSTGSHAGSATYHTAAAAGCTATPG